MTQEIMTSWGGRRIVCQPLAAELPYALHILGPDGRDVIWRYYATEEEAIGDLPLSKKELSIKYGWGAPDKPRRTI